MTDIVSAGQCEEGKRIVNSLRLRGYAVLPVPRGVEPGEGSVRPDASWQLVLTNVNPSDIAVRTLQAELEREHGFALAAVPSERRVELSLQFDAVTTGAEPRLHAQAYRMEISAQRIAIAGNGAPGLFHGVQTLLQLMEGEGSRRGLLPVVRIADWPEYALRCIHLDTKHHQDRPETLRRYLDQAARFKINAILFEIEDKFEYPSHPVIGAPGAFTTAELQALVNYGLERHIQVIPNIQGPAHMAYVLKHEAFAHLRCDGSNYQICMDEPEARKLLFDLYDDLCEATKGVEFFHVSTDEVYYAGICEKHRRPYNAENRSLTWVDYVNAAHAHLSQKGRRVIVWGEYPLLAEHVRLLPRDLLNGVGGRHEIQTRAEAEHGIRPFLYASLQGVELLFPNYFAHVDRDGRFQPGRLESAYHATLLRGLHPAEYIGTIAAAWDDSGLHSQTFWLGWAMMAQGSWKPGVSVEETVANFMDLFYGGREIEDMTDVYHALQMGARFYEHTLERLPSRVRTPAYGDWDGKRVVQRTDRAMVPPALPNPPDLSVVPAFRPRYARAIAEVPEQIAANDRLLMHLHINLTRVRRNRHNLEVYLSIAYYLRHFLYTVLATAAAEDLLVEAAGAAAQDKKVKALRLLMDAAAKVQPMNEDLYVTFENLRSVWEKSRYPKGRSVNGRAFVHVMDDVKDHLGDRRPDLSYVIAPEENIGLANWLRELQKIIDAYAAAHGLDKAAVRQAELDE
jgi:hypothetical protein